MILVDTSIWIEHFRKNDPELVAILRENRVCIHPMIIGELACGSLRQRSEILPLLQLLPLTESPSQDEVLHFLEKRKIFGQGIGWVDANLLASCLLSQTTLWTRDKSLLKAAKCLQLNYS